MNYYSSFSTGEFISDPICQLFSFFIFPTTKYKNIVSKKHADCPICLDSFGEESCISLLECGHIFHYNCILKWSEKGNSCPLCRKSLESYIIIYETIYEKQINQENYYEDYDIYEDDYEDDYDSEDLGDYDLFSYNRSEN